MNLQNWIDLARSHWKEHLPKRFKAEREAGTLNEALKSAAELTYSEISQLEEAGFHPDEAWQMVRENYLLLPAEPETEERLELSVLHEAMSEYYQAMSADQEEAAETS